MNAPNATVGAGLWRLLGWFLAVYLLLFHLSDLLRAVDRTAVLTRYAEPTYLVKMVLTGVAWFSYSAGQYLVLRRWYGRLPHLLLGLLLAALTLACMFGRAFWEEVVGRALTGSGNYYPQMSWGDYLLDQILYAVVFSSLGLVFYFVERAAREARARRRSEGLRREAELKFLRSQVNPHFLFNTLNNLYSLVNAGSPRALSVLDKLAGMLRYSLYEQSARVPLHREVGYLRDLIALEEMRVADLAAVDLKIGPFQRSWELPPLLLLPFVENAFKHGELRASGHPLRIRLGEDGRGHLRFTVENRIRPSGDSRNGRGGIGIANVRQRLALLYPDRHRLTVGATDGRFRVDLRLAPDAAPVGGGNGPAAPTTTASPVAEGVGPSTDRSWRGWAEP